MSTMSFIRNKPRKLASGEIRNYYYEVENYWQNGKVRQRVIRYLGTKPYLTKFEIDHEIAKQISQVLLEKDLTPAQVKDKLENIGISMPEGELGEVHLMFKPPLRSYSLRID